MEAVTQHRGPPLTSAICNHSVSVPQRCGDQTQLPSNPKQNSAYEPAQSGHERGLLQVPKPDLLSHKAFVSRCLHMEQHILHSSFPQF